MTRVSPLPLLLTLLAVASVPTPASAETTLNRATITRLRNRVQLKPKGQRRRAAKPKDVLQIADQLATGRRSLAEFQFNEGTAVRMGERAVFRFIPKSRNFLLNQGTALLLIPPGLGRSRVRTPSVQVGIRGSALFVRHDPTTNTTIVGALTSSGITVSEPNDGQVQRLEAGQMAVAVDGNIEGLYNFDLLTFYETSSLTEGVLAGKFGSKKVLEEIQAGLAIQGDFPPIATTSQRLASKSKDKVVQTPDFIKLSEDVATPLATTLNQAESELETATAGSVLEVTETLPGNLSVEDGATFPGRSLGLPPSVTPSATPTGEAEPTEKDILQPVVPAPANQPTPVQPAPAPLPTQPTNIPAPATPVTPVDPITPIEPNLPLQPTEVVEPSEPETIPGQGLESLDMVEELNSDGLSDDMADDMADDIADESAQTIGETDPLDNLDDATTSIVENSDSSLYNSGDLDNLDDLDVSDDLDDLDDLDDSDGLDDLDSSEKTPQDFPGQGNGVGEERPGGRP